MRSPVNDGLVTMRERMAWIEIHHLRLARIRVLFDAVQLQRLRRAAAALVQRGDESGLVADLGGLLLEIAHSKSSRRP